MADKRQSPKAKAAGRDTAQAFVGNYTAPVDTTGMDESMKSTMKKKSTRKPMGLVERVKKMMGIQY